MSPICPALLVMTVNWSNAADFTASLICVLSFEMVDCQSPDSYAVAVTGLPPSCWAVILSFILRGEAFLFSLEAGDTDGHSVDMMGCLHPSEIPEKSEQNIVPCRGCSPLWSRGWLGAAQHHQRVSPIASLGKRSKFKLWRTLSTECVSLLHHGKVEKSQIEPLQVCMQNTVEEREWELESLEFQHSSPGVIPHHHHQELLVLSTQSLLS